MNSKHIWLASLASFALVGCASTVDQTGDDTDSDSGGKADVSAATLAAAGYYRVGGTADTNRWIEDMNLHSDGTFEADFGDGSLQFGSHVFATDGTFSVDAKASTITFKYTFETATTDVYKLANVSGGMSLEYVGDAGEAQFTVNKGDRPVTLTFGADKAPTLSVAALGNDEPVLVEYAVARSACSVGTSEITPPIVMLMATDGNFGQQTVIEMPIRAIDGNYRALFSTSAGHSLAVWFEQSTVDAQGNTSCDKFDSNNGGNYNFDLVAQ